MSRARRQRVVARQTRKRPDDSITGLLRRADWAAFSRAWLALQRNPHRAPTVWCAADASPMKRAPIVDRLFDRPATGP